MNKKIVVAFNYLLCFILVIIKTMDFTTTFIGIKNHQIIEGNPIFYGRPNDFQFLIMFFLAIIQPICAILINHTLTKSKTKYLQILTIMLFIFIMINAYVVINNFKILGCI